jgi:hypothetical protein
MMHRIVVQLGCDNVGLVFRLGGARATREGRSIRITMVAVLLSVPVRLFLRKFNIPAPWTELRQTPVGAIRSPATSVINFVSPPPPGLVPAGPDATLFASHSEQNGGCRS